MPPFVGAVDLERFFIMFGFVFCLILLFSVEIKHYKSLGYVFLFSFLNFLPQYTHWVLLRLRSHAFCHSEPVLFFSPPLFLPHSISPLVGGGAGAWGCCCRL